MMDETRPYSKTLPPTLLLVAVILMLGLHFLFPIMQMVPGFWPLLGLIPLGFGIFISYAAENQFHQAGTTIQPFEESSRLVTDGWYRFSRNPMYLGMAFVLFGVALLFGSLTPFGVIVIFVGWIDIQFIRREEEMLSTQFGPDWLEYRARVRRWI
jgi:protein-S-isoprenylcysteine O-methyltransferase Ste14